jgi:2-octaprenyl-6-methoxyphenol hydroxylase
MKPFDVIIAGGGMTGMTLALAINAFSQKKLSIAIVEPFSTEQDVHPGFDARCIALAQGTVKTLDSMGLWSLIDKFATPIHRIHVSDRGHLGMTDINGEDLNFKSLGFVVELSDIGKVYRQQVELENNIQVFHHAVVNIERSLEHVTVQMGEQHRIQGKLFVAADGTWSDSCRQVGIGCHQHDFDQTAIIANVKTQKSHQGQAFERFTHSGPLALLPMSEGRMSLAWCMGKDTADEILKLDDADFLRELQYRFGWRLGKISHVGKRSSYPLKLVYREENTSHRFAMIGNAAQTLHPIAGQGFNLGIRDVSALAEQIAMHPKDPGCYSALNEFSRARAADRNATISMTSSLVQIFSNDYLSLRIGRNLGLLGLDRLPVLKKPLIKRSLGLIAR